jgi:type II secretory pathway component PulJ
MAGSNHSTLEMINIAKKGIAAVESGNAKAGVGVQQIAAAIMEMITAKTVFTGDADQRKLYSIEAYQQSTHDPKAEQHKDALRVITVMVLGEMPAKQKGEETTPALEHQRAEYRSRSQLLRRGFALGAVLIREYSHVDFTDKGFRVTVADILPDGWDAVRQKHDTPIVLDNKTSVLAANKDDKLRTFRASVDSVMRAYAPAGKARATQGLNIDKALSYIAKHLPGLDPAKMTGTQREAYNTALAAMAAFQSKLAASVDQQEAEAA